MLTWIAITIFLATFALIVFEVFEKSVLALMGAILMIAFGIFSFEEAVLAIKFETIILLMAMMLLVEVARESGMFSVLTVKLAKKSKGNPMLLFLFFTGVTAFISAFLDNVTTIVIIVPITIALIKGMGRDPKPYVIAEIMYSNIGGAMTLIGDSSNIIIGGASGLSFNQFLVNLVIPGILSMVLIGGIFAVTHWKNHLKPISKDLKRLFLSHILLHKIDYKFLSLTLNKQFMVKSVAVLILTTLGFVFQKDLELSVATIALTGAMFLLLVSAEEADLQVSLKSVEWSTLLFFAGLFVMVGGLEKVGALEPIGDFVVQISGGSYAVLLMALVWITGLASMLVDNVLFVALMVPVIFDIQEHLPAEADPNLLWWALSLGACLGGNGTIIGGSANVIGTGIAKKDGVEISFLEFLKYGLPLTAVALLISSVYIGLRATL